MHRSKPDGTPSDPSQMSHPSLLLVLPYLNIDLSNKTGTLETSWNLKRQDYEQGDQKQHHKTS